MNRNFLRTWGSCFGGRTLISRIRRLAGLDSTRARRAVWWVIATVSAGVLAILAMVGPGDRKALAPKNRSEEKAVALRDEWGPESGGVRCRLIAVSAGSNDEAPDGAVTTNSFPSGDDVTFAVDLKNVSRKPFTLLGVRYGESYGGASGKLATESIAPHLFTWEFTDPTGKPIPRPERVLVGGLALMGASAHEIAPGKSLRVLMRPARFGSSMEYLLPPGDYRARVRYCSSGRGNLAELTETRPDMPQAIEWSGEVVSNQVAFTVGGVPGTPKPADLRWGPAKGGLRAAVRFETDPSGDVPINSWVDVVLHLENVSDHPISLTSETLRQDDKVTVKYEPGIEKEIGGPWYSFGPTLVSWTLRPGEVAELGTLGLTVAANDEAIKKLKGLAGKIFKTWPGTYSFRYTIRLGEGDWQGELVTGETPLPIRARTREDDARDRGETFVGRIEFLGKDGKAIDRGSFTARPDDETDDGAALEIHPGPITIPDCSSSPYSVSVCAPGYEEEFFHGLELKANETRRLELTPAAATRFRLVSSQDGKPIAGAKVRFFNRSSDKAASGPLPMSGLEGPVWATSGDDGRVLLDTLRKTDPHYPKLGDSVYFFYVEAAGLSGRYVGAVKAGKDLGDIKMGGPLEVHGEIRGTPEELKRFEAVWDQSFDIPTASPWATNSYAVSQRLGTYRDGDRLTFHLEDLRHGKLRIIGTFGPLPVSISGGYIPRDPKGADFVVAVDLTESLPHLVLTPSRATVPPP